MWQAVPSRDYEQRHKKYEKQHRRELQAVLRNLDTFLEALRAGAKPSECRLGFLRPEPHGVLAIDERHGGAKLTPTRLYVFADEDTETLHVLILGDKSTQNDDIRACKEFVLKLRKRKERERRDEEA